MSKVIEYCMHHKDDPEDEEDDDFPKRSDDIDEWDLQFMQVDQEMLFSILLASNFLEIKPLMDLGCKTVANMIRNKDAKQIRQMFNIADDPSEEENKKIEEANEWSEAH
ncbi:hypothetical protein LPJ56_005246 [Coemansia sp. RSA 2599]|nr:hypothetical protein LPJ56_005246 [Coemansia sp. RSA 2599]